jgi:hypothetical protein
MFVRPFTVNVMQRAEPPLKKRRDHVDIAGLAAGIEFEQANKAIKEASIFANDRKTRGKSEQTRSRS